jgi:large subunit ribosomal protein L1
VIRAKPAASKGQYLKSISLAGTMTPGIPIDPLKTTSLGAAGAA